MAAIDYHLEGSDPPRITSCLTLCGAGHFAVDFACALAVVSLPVLFGIPDSDYYLLVILYNLVAFGSQPFWGWLIDRWSVHREGMTAGILITCLGAAVALMQPLLAVLLLGCGNALFHVGAGAIVYAAAPGRAAGPGLFVAPGGIGLVAGIMIGLKGTMSTLWMVPVLVVTALLLHHLFPVPETAALPDSEKGKEFELLPAILLLFLLVVGLRSFTGFALPIPWKGVENGVLFLALASFAGKASGGFLADCFGWRPLCGVMLVIAAVAGFAHHSYLLATCAGLFCIQATTGVTLAGVQSLFPGWPAFSFGLPCIALLIGAFPFFLPHPLGQIHPELAAALCLCAALAVLWALILYKNRSN